jgi:hypothetical protein
MLALVESSCFLSVGTSWGKKNHSGDAMGMRTEILCYDNGSEGLGHQIHLFQAEVLPYGL